MATVQVVSRPAAQRYPPQRQFANALGAIPSNSNSSGNGRTPIKVDTGPRLGTWQAQQQYRSSTGAPLGTSMDDETVSSGRSSVDRVSAGSAGRGGGSGGGGSGGGGSGGGGGGGGVVVPSTVTGVTQAPTVVQGTVVGDRTGGAAPRSAERYA